MLMTLVLFVLSAPGFADEACEQELDRSEIATRAEASAVWDAMQGTLSVRNEISVSSVEAFIEKYTSIHERNEAGLCVRDLRFDALTKARAWLEEPGPAPTDYAAPEVHVKEYSEREDEEDEEDEEV